MITITIGNFIGGLVLAGFIGFAIAYFLFDPNAPGKRKSF